MDELRNGFHFHRTIETDNSISCDQQSVGYKNVERCKKYDKQMQHTRMKEQILDKGQEMIVVEDYE